MNRLYFFAILFLPFVISTQSCAEVNKKTEIKTWVFSQREDKTPIYLYINDTAQGSIPFLGNGITCNDADSIKAKALPIILSNKQYKVEVKRKNGSVISAGKMTITKDGMEFKGLLGGMDARQTDDCMVIEAL
jgi:hypothetical protein